MAMASALLALEWERKIRDTANTLNEVQPQPTTTADTKCYQPPHFFRFEAALADIRAFPGGFESGGYPSALLRRV
jgi:hypothetical protein